MTIHLTLADVVALHVYAMERYGIPPRPLRSEGALESAIQRARMAEHYEEADVVRQAAVLASGISQAQAFMDGNKRTAFLAADVFLERNGLVLVGDPLDFVQLLEAIAMPGRDRSAAEAELELWLRGGTARIGG